MSKSRPQVKGKLNKRYDWLISHVPKPIKDGASKEFKTFNPISTGGGGGVCHPMPSKWLRTPQRNKLAP